MNAHTMHILLHRHGGGWATENKGSYSYVCAKVMCQLKEKEKEKEKRPNPNHNPNLNIACWSSRVCCHFRPLFLGS